MQSSVLKLHTHKQPSISELGEDQKVPLLVGKINLDVLVYS